MHLCNRLGCRELHVDHSMKHMYMWLGTYRYLVMRGLTSTDVDLDRDKI